jgi:hypothetical protein
VRRAPAPVAWLHGGIHRARAADGRARRET